MRHVLRLLILVLFISLLSVTSGCNTMKGFAQDVDAAGQVIEEKTKKK